MWKAYLFIYLGSLCYVAASYYHLKLPNWTFTKAFFIAIPFVLVEYQFSLRGNYMARSQLRVNPLQILIITMCFYFVNLWLLNHFLLKQPVNTITDTVAFALVLLAFGISNRRS